MDAIISFFTLLQLSTTDVGWPAGAAIALVSAFGGFLA